MTRVAPLLASTAMTRVGPPEPPSSLCGMLYTVNPVAGKFSMLKQRTFLIDAQRSKFEHFFN
jgi:hypothetical protein